MGSEKYLIVGAGFSGAVIARELAEEGLQVVCIDKRNHIAGNCHTERDKETNIMIHKYGPHIFNTNNKEVWEYVNNFGEFMPFKNKVIAETKNGIFSMPMNLLTINQFFNKKLNPSTVAPFLKTKQENITVPNNFEEQALRFLGRELYDNFFYGYTKKQWGCEPTELPASILKRLPIRFNYNDNYYNAIFQGIPKDGYSAIIENILNHENIEVQLNTSYDKLMNPNYGHVFYSGRLDQYYDYQFGRLGYRTVEFNEEIHKGDFQGNAVINYCDETVAHTRVHEHKHFSPWEKHDKTVVVTEYSKETKEEDEPFYPKRLKKDMEMLAKYQNKSQEPKGNISFIGRLGTYRYLDMDKVIEEALETANDFIKSK